MQGSTNVFVKDQHPVQVSVACSLGITRPAPLLIQGASADSTQCITNVTDTATNPQTPTGTLTWSLQGTNGSGSFSPASCTLVPAGPVGTAQCPGPVTYQPSVRGTPDAPDQESSHQMTATFAGDWLHPVATQNSATVFVGNFHPAQVVVNCLPLTTRMTPLLVVGPPPTSAACTVTVTDTSPSPITPTGSIGWSMSSIGAGGAGSFTPSAPCPLQAAGPSTAQCNTPVTYQPTVRGTPDGLGVPPDMDNTHHVTATYSGVGVFTTAVAGAESGTSDVYVNN